MKLKENKKHDFLNNINNNSIRNNNFSNEKIANIYVKKKSLNNHKKKNYYRNYNSEIFNNISLKKRNISENLNEINKLINRKFENPKIISEEKANKKINISYTYKKAINKNSKNKFSKEKINKEKFFSKINQHIIISKDNRLHISISSIKLPYLRHNKNIFYKNNNLKISNFSFNIKRNIIFNKNKIKERNTIKIYNHRKNNNSFVLNTKKEKKREYRNYTLNINPLNELKNLDNYKNISTNYQNNKYLNGCIKFLIKAIKRILYYIFSYLKNNSKYYQLKNVINKINNINNKRIEKYYLNLFMKKIKENKKKTKSENKENKKNKKIVFNNKTKRYELVNI